MECNYTMCCFKNKSAKWRGGGVGKLARGRYLLVDEWAQIWCDSGTIAHQGIISNEKFFND